MVRSGASTVKLSELAVGRAAQQWSALGPESKGHGRGEDEMLRGHQTGSWWAHGNHEDYSWPSVEI